jgi:hypothetical protein
MQEKSLLKKNILQFIEYKGLSKAKFYQDTGITRGILDQNNGLSEENLTRFLAFYPEVSLQWLFFGIGEMTTSEKSERNHTEKSMVTEPNDKEINHLSKLLKEREKVVSTQELLIKSQEDVISLLKSGRDHNREVKPLNDSDYEKYIINNKSESDGHYRVQ